MRNLLFVLSLLISGSLAAKEKPILTIDGKNISKEEFESIYNKNNTNLNDESEVKSPEDYMNMFIDFKLKVIEAENRGMDTTRAFAEELNGYRNELAKSYLTDVSYTDSMIKQAYYRTTNLLKASHILIFCEKNSSPEDTLKAYNKAMEIRKMYLNKEKTFAELAREYSQDPSAKSNSGSLPMFKAFQMITPFENGAWATKVGEISMPVRTEHGFHLILVEAKNPSLGEMKVAHIMKKFNSIDNVTPEEDQKDKAFIDSVYNLLQNGDDFARLAQELSDDKISAKNGGEMNYIDQGFGVETFANAAFELKNNGDYSKPVRTPYGWHIIKRLDLRPPRTFAEMKDELTKRVKSDPLRSMYSKNKFIDARKAEYGYSQNDDNINKLYTIIEKTNGDTVTVFPGEGKNLLLFNFAGKDYYGNDLFAFLNTKKQTILKYSFSKYLPAFVEETVTAYENSRLEDKYPEFRYLINEYHDGILLFSIMEKEVWNKAIEDSVGLEKYYEQHKGKYLFGEHFDGLLIKCDSAGVKDIIKKAIADGITNPDSLNAIAEQNGGKKNTVTKGRWEKGSNRDIDYLIWKGDKPRDLNEDLSFVVGGIKKEGVKTLDEARGLYISDYQNELEQEWISKLHKKYSIKVYKALLHKVKSLAKK